jgi:hypothetical protein
LYLLKILFKSKKVFQIPYKKPKAAKTAFVLNRDGILRGATHIAQQNAPPYEIF